MSSALFYRSGENPVVLVALYSTVVHVPGHRREGIGRVRTVCSLRVGRLGEAGDAVAEVVGEL